MILPDKHHAINSEPIERQNIDAEPVVPVTVVASLTVVASHNGTPESATDPGSGDSDLRNHLSTNSKPSTTRNLEYTSKHTKTQNPAFHPAHHLNNREDFYKHRI